MATEFAKARLEATLRAMRIEARIKDGELEVLDPTLEELERLGKTMR